MSLGFIFFGDGDRGGGNTITPPLVPSSKNSNFEKEEY